MINTEHRDKLMKALQAHYDIATVVDLVDNFDRESTSNRVYAENAREHLTHLLEYMQNGGKLADIPANVTEVLNSNAAGLTQDLLNLANMEEEQHGGNPTGHAKWVAGIRDAADWINPNNAERVQWEQRTGGRL